MFLRAVVIILAVCLAGILFPWSESDARGGGGFRGGGMSGFHLGGPVGERHVGTNRDRRDMHRTHGHQDDSQRFNERRGDSHFARSDFGHWHSSPGFGNKVHNSASFDGRWHIGREFR
jgi:hypothetical protein